MDPSAKCDIVQDIFSYFENIVAAPEKGNVENYVKNGEFIICISGAAAISLVTSCVCLVLALLFNIYIAVNIIYKRKFQVSNGSLEIPPLQL